MWRMMDAVQEVGLSVQQGKTNRSYTKRNPTRSRFVGLRGGWLAEGVIFNGF